jgi:hypothetical protein
MSRHPCHEKRAKRYLTALPAHMPEEAAPGSMVFAKPGVQILQVIEVV